MEAYVAFAGSGHRLSEANHLYTQHCILGDGFGLPCQLPLCQWASLAAVWVAWTDAVEFGRRTQGLLHRFEARRKACVLRAAISAWQGAVQSRHAFITRFQDMLDRRGMQLMDGAFCGWRDATAASRSQRVRTYHDPTSSMYQS